MAKICDDNTCVIHVADVSAESGSGLSSWLFGLAAGTLGGLTLALLFAPRPGREVRGIIKNKAQEVPGRVNELIDDSLDLYASGLNYTQLLMEEQTQRMKRAVAAGKLAAAKKREELEMGASSVLPFQHR